MAENDGKIYITISDKRFGNNVAEADAQNKSNKDENKENVLGEYAKHQFFSLIKSQATQAVNYTIGNIGNFTGDYVKQQHIQDTMQVLNFGISLAMAGYAGLKMTGSPIGAAIAVATAVIGKGITTAQELYAGSVENARINNDIRVLRTRAGLNSTNNESRGTDQ